MTLRCDFENIRYDSLALGSRRALTSRHSGVVLEKVAEYLMFNEKHVGSTDVADPEIPPELCLELLMAADYLDGSLDCPVHATLELISG